MGYIRYTNLYVHDLELLYTQIVFFILQRQYPSTEQYQRKIFKSLYMNYIVRCNDNNCLNRLFYVYNAWNEIYWLDAQIQCLTVFRLFTIDKKYVSQISKISFMLYRHA